MNSLKSLTALLLTLGITSAKAETPLIAQTPAASALFQSMSKFADDGASVEHFSFTEAVDIDSSLNQCRIVSQRVAFERFKQIAGTILPSRELKEHESAFSEISRVLGDQSSWYTHCKSQSCGGHSCEVVDTFLAVGGDYRVSFVVGYED